MRKASRSTTGPSSPSLTDPSSFPTRSLGPGSTPKRRLSWELLAAFSARSSSIRRVRSTSSSQLERRSQKRRAQTETTLSSSTSSQLLYAQSFQGPLQERPFTDRVCGNQPNRRSATHGFGSGSHRCPCLRQTRSKPNHPHPLITRPDFQKRQKLPQHRQHPMKTACIHSTVRTSPTE